MKRKTMSPVTRSASLAVVLVVLGGAGQVIDRRGCRLVEGLADGRRVEQVDGLAFDVP